MISIGRGSPLPPDDQLKQVLLARVARGEFRPGVPRPGWRTLSAREFEAPPEAAERLGLAPRRAARGLL